MHIGIKQLKNIGMKITRVFSIHVADSLTGGPSDPDELRKELMEKLREQ
jgi:hypothetical protein